MSFSAQSLLHLLNDVMQALLAAIYPMLKSGFALSFGQIGVLTLIFQVSASVLQPLGGLYTDRRPQPYSLPLGMACSLIGVADPKDRDGYCGFTLRAFRCQISTGR